MVVYEIKLEGKDQIYEERYTIDGAFQAARDVSRKVGAAGEWRRTLLIRRDGLTRTILCIYKDGKRSDAKKCPECKGESRLKGVWCATCGALGVVPLLT